MSCDNADNLSEFVTFQIEELLEVPISGLKPEAFSNVCNMEYLPSSLVVVWLYVDWSKRGLDWMVEELLVRVLIAAPNLSWPVHFVISSWSDILLSILVWLYYLRLTSKWLCENNTFVPERIGPTECNDLIDLWNTYARIETKINIQGQSTLGLRK